MKINLFVDTFRGILRASAAQTMKNTRGRCRRGQTDPSCIRENVFMNCITFLWPQIYNTEGTAIVLLAGGSSRYLKKPRAHHCGRGLLS